VNRAVCAGKHFRISSTVTWQKFYLDLISRDIPNRKLAILQTIFGILLLCGVMGVAAVRYNEYQVELSRIAISDSLSVNLVTVISITVLNILAAILLFHKITLVTGIWLGG
jgi:hypothetical protein